MLYRVFGDDISSQLDWTRNYIDQMTDEGMCMPQVEDGETVEFKSSNLWWGGKLTYKSGESNQDDVMVGMLEHMLGNKW